MASDDETPPAEPAEAPVEVAAEPAPAAETPVGVAPEAAPEDDGPAPEPVEDAKGWLAPLLVVLAAAFVVLFVLPPLTKAGIWDPYELNVADLARRVALKLHGASALALEGADNSLPHLNDLGRPQLPFTSIALGFSFFGLREWAGRAPLAVWGLLGAVVTYGFVARLVDRRAGVFSAVALLTMPLYFVQARTMLGDITTMASLAMAFGGLAVAAFGNDDDGAPAHGVRLPWLAVGVLGLVAGYYSRGALLGVVVPAGAVGLTWGVLVGAERRLDPMAHAVGVASGLIAALALYPVTSVLFADTPPTDMNPWIGATLHPPAKYPTFDYVIGHLAHAMAPWSAFVPFAVGRLFIAPKGRPSPALARESAARMALLLGATAALVAHGVLAARADLIAFSGPALLAAIAGIALRDYERGAHASVALGVGTMVLLGLLHHDYHNVPDKAYQAFGIAQAIPFPESFKDKSLALWTVVLIGFAGVAFLTWVERDAKRRPFDPKTYLAVLRSVRDAWDGFLVLAYFALVAGTSLSGLAVWFGTRNHARWLTTVPLQVREIAVGAWWKAALGPPALLFGLLFWCDVWLWAFSRQGGGRSLGRGFEPFEALVASLRGGPAPAGKKPVPAHVALFRVAFSDKATEEEALSATSLGILAPLLFLQLPGVVYVALHKGGVRPMVASALAVPAGVLAFLAFGVIGDLLRRSRAAFLVVFGVVTGLVLSAGYYPALANQLSPKDVFESYRRFKQGDEPLALLGVGGRTAAYYAGGQPLLLADAPAAQAWLTGAPAGSRRFISAKADQLGRLNQLYRTTRGANVPVLDGRSSQIVLIASELRAGETSESPLDTIVLSAAPKPQRRLDVNLEDKLQ
ncbi:MAG TPA: glycosyltransferase family 39 protein, partial [Polyangiaceae bacterium]|nr:glycosyltransferase family 39 protein [Polyangiaceae bacterium]